MDFLVPSQSGSSNRNQLGTLGGFRSVTPFPARNGGNETGDLGVFLTPDVVFLSLSLSFQVSTAQRTCLLQSYSCKAVKTQIKLQFSLN